MNAKEISGIVDSWIDEEELPVSAGLKPIRKYDLYSEMDEEEIQAYFDFMEWYFCQEHLLFLDLPRLEEPDFWPVELDDFGNDISAFNTHDYERLHPFDRYHWKLKKAYERVKELALTHSCISQEEGRENIYQRYKNLVENEFRDEGVMLLEHYKKYKVWIDKEKLFEKIEVLNSRIRKCKKIWREYAYWE